MKDYVRKIKNFFLNKFNKKEKIIVFIILFTICFFLFDLGGLLGRIFTSISNLFSNVDGEVKQIVIKGNGYDEEVGGSVQITKSADWTNNNAAILSYDVESKIKIASGDKDVILILDTSNSTDGNKLNNLKEDAMKLISLLLLNESNKLGIITFDDTAKIVASLSNNKNELLESLESITINNGRNYYNAFIKLEELLKTYEVSDNRELVILFVTDGAPLSGSPNHIVQYQSIKKSYPNSIIYGINYNPNLYLKNTLCEISDTQIEAKNGYNVMLEPALNPYYYDSFEMVEYIDNDYFYIESDEDIKVSLGEVLLTTENNKQKIIWSISNNKFRSGRTVTMNINLKLNDNLVGVEGLYSMLSGSKVSYTLDDSNASIESNETPILKNGYKVSYDINTPSGCDISYDLEEIHYTQDSIQVKSEILTCNGWQFQGWNVIEDVVFINDSSFIMPNYNVTLKGKWSKFDLNKSMTGNIVTSQEGIYITDITYVDSKYVNLNTSAITGFNQTNMNSNITLNNNSDAYITYKVTVYNSTDTDYYYDKTLSSFSNSNIEYELSIDEKTDLKSKDSITFTVTFKYNDSYSVSGATNVESLLNFKFRKKIAIIDMKSLNGDYHLSLNCTNSQCSTYSVDDFYLVIDEINIPLPAYGKMTFTKSYNSNTGVLNILRKALTGEGFITYIGTTYGNPYAKYIGSVSGGYSVSIDCTSVKDYQNKTADDFFYVLDWLEAPQNANPDYPEDEGVYGTIVFTKTYNAEKGILTIKRSSITGVGTVTMQMSVYYMNNE